jgi:hypothetical protein
VSRVTTGHLPPRSFIASECHFVYGEKADQKLLDLLEVTVIRGLRTNVYMNATSREMRDAYPSRFKSVPKIRDLTNANRAWVATLMWLQLNRRI